MVLDNEPRLPRGQLASDVDGICKQWANDEIELEENQYLTPYVVGTLLIEECDGERKRPSTGAITSVFKRWENKGYANFRKVPFAFVGYTEEGRESGNWISYKKQKTSPNNKK